MYIITVLIVLHVENQTLGFGFVFGYFVKKKKSSEVGKPLDFHGVSCDKVFCMFCLVAPL